MTTSQTALDYFELWRADLLQKGFHHVRLLEGRLVHLAAQRPNGQQFRGFAAFEPSDLDLKLRQALEDAANGGCITFLVTSYDLMENARSIIRSWGLEKSVNLESVM